MPRFVVAITALILTSSFALAQNSTSNKFQVFAGYSLFHADTGGLNGAALDSALGAPSGTFGMSSDFNGWNAEAQYNANRWLGVVVDFSGRYGTPLTTSSGSGVSGLPSENAYTFLFGPVLSYKTQEKMAPFIHALFGIDRTHLGAGTLTGLSFSHASAVTDTAFAMALGGGLDYNLFPHFALRLGQLDYLYTGHDLNSIYGGAFGSGVLRGLATHENNLRFSTGIVLRF